MSKTAVPPGGRKLTINVKTAKKRSPASAEWLRRQLNDPYVVAAKTAGVAVSRGVQVAGTG